MEPDETAKKPASAMVIGENLDVISVVELEQRIVALETEINRVRAEIARKQASLKAAHSFFRT